MRSHIVSAILSSIVFAPVLADCAPAQPTVHVGDGTLDGSFLEPYNNAWLYTATGADGQVHVQGVWSDHMQWTDVAGKRALMRVLLSSQ